MVIVAGFAVTVMFVLVPVKPPPVAVTVWIVPVVELVVNVTVAMPLAFVVLVAVEKEPPFVLDHVTTIPDTGTALLKLSASWAVMVTAEPGTGEYELEVTRNLLATRNVTVLSVLVDARFGWFPVMLTARSAAIEAMTVPLTLIP
jgi:hypothetical protein